MDEKERNQFVHELLEASLARYGNVTPRPGLEGRILANAKATKARRTWFMWAGWLAAGAVAALIAVGILSLRHRPAIPAPPKAAEVVKPSTPLETSPRPVTVRPDKRSHAPRRPQVEGTRLVAPAVARVEVRQPVFPSPTPLSGQEQLLLACLKLSPGTQEAIFKKGKNTAEELEIEPLPPLANDSEGVEGENNR